MNGIQGNNIFCQVIKKKLYIKGGFHSGKKRNMEIWTSPYGKYNLIYQKNFKVWKLINFRIETLPN